MTGALRVEQDVGLLTNIRMAVEVAVAIAHLSGRRLSMPFEVPIPPAPVSSIPHEKRGIPGGVLDLLELPVAVVHPDEWASEFDGRAVETHDWGIVGEGVCVVDPEMNLDDPVFRDFLNGRKKVWTIPQSDARTIEISARLLTFYSYFFFATGPTRRSLHALIRGVRPRQQFRELGAKIADDVGRFNAVHIRRSDLTKGIPAYNSITPEMIAHPRGSQRFILCSAASRGQRARTRHAAGRCTRNLLCWNHGFHIHRNDSTGTNHGSTRGTAWLELSEPSRTGFDESRERACRRCRRAFERTGDRSSYRSVRAVRARG